jgi:hypothetical protein
MLNEQQIEAKVERIMDRWDKCLMAGLISQEDYDNEVMILDKWASQQYEALKPAPFKEDFRNYA